ncbi:MAG: molybdopterin-dependent oxidoreductase, partial [Campylobacteraceae bacterium]
MSMETRNISHVSRRSFLKTAGAAGLLATIGVDLGFANVLKAAEVDIKKTTSDGWHYGHCRMCMRGCCPNMYRVENGIAVEIQGNPKAPNSKGGLCAKGQAIIQNTYNPYRVKAPMKRTNPIKGLDVDPKWIEISWEEALQTTADKLSKIYKEDPRELIYQVGFGDMDYFSTFEFYFAHAFKTPNYVKSNGILCTLHYASDLIQGVFPCSAPDGTYINYLVCLGMHLGLSLASAEGGARVLFERMYDDREMKIVMIDPRGGPESSKGEWVPCRPGGDLAFLLAMTYSIFYEVKKMDFYYLQWRTTSPYLIGQDEMYIRGKDGKPQIRDKSDGKIKSFDDKTLKDPDLWVDNITVDGKKATSALTLLKRSLKEYTPEWAEKICDIPASKTREIAHDYIANASIGEYVYLENSKGEKVKMPVRRSLIEAGRGLKNQRDGVANDLMSKLLAMLVGGIELPGGTVGKARGIYHLLPDADGVVAPKGEAKTEHDLNMQWPPQYINLFDWFPHKHTSPVHAYRVSLDPQKYGFDYNIKALFTIGSNPIASTSDPYMIEEAIKKIPFGVCLAYHYDEMAQMADILFASHSLLEKESVNCFEGAFDMNGKDTNNLRLMMYRDPIAPIYNTRQPQDIVMELAERMGILSEFNADINKVGIILGEVTNARLEEDKGEFLDLNRRYTVNELWNIGIKKSFGVDMDYFRQNDGIIISYRAPAEAYNAYWYRDGESRHPVYWNTTKIQGEIQTKYFEEHDETVSKYPGFDWKDNMNYYESLIKWRSKELLDVKEDDEFNLVSINWKSVTLPSRCGGSDQKTWLEEAAVAFDPSFGKMSISSMTADNLGSKEGELWGG